MKRVTDRDWWRVASAAIAAALLAFAAGAARSQEPEIKDAPRATGYKPLTEEQRKHYQALSRSRHGQRLAMMAKFQALPSAFDCRDKKWVLKTGDQGNCGSCYLYSTIYYTMTSAFIRAGYGKNDGSFVMSVQYGMDRPRNFGGCGGGNGTEVIEWARTHGWIAERYVDISGVTHNDYPEYEARTANDRTKAGAKKWQIAEWGFITPNGQFDQEAMKAAMVNYGPLNIALDAGGQFGNGTGTITSMGGNINHEISCVAYDDAKDGGAVLLHNQWDVTWGNGGYRWCTYKACRNIVDWFYVTATPLPPPPPDPNPPGPGPPGQFFITPATVTIAPKATQQFTMTPPALVWVAIDGGTITQEGLYTAPDKAGTYSILAVSSKPAGMATATITVSNTPPPPVGPQIVIGPDVKPGTYVLLKPGFEIAPAGTLAELERIKAAVNALLPAPKAEPKTEEPPVIEQPKIEAPAVEAEPPPLPIPPPETPSQREKYDPTTGKRDPRTGKLLKGSQP